MTKSRQPRALRAGGNRAERGRQELVARAGAHVDPSGDDDHVVPLRVIGSGRRDISNHASISQPMSKVITVTGTPTLQYSRNPISTRAARAASTTIRFATLPRIVRLPARVEPIASTS